MKLTKFVHSCVLVEHSGKAVLFDPGMFSWDSGTVDLSVLPGLDTVVVSHKHPDHFYEPFVKELIRKFPDAQWAAPLDTHADLQSWGAKKITNQSVDDLDINEIEHAVVEPFGIQVHNLITHFMDLVTHPGDTHNFTETKDILLLPVQAPWGTTIRAIELANQLKPKYILPIHDWMWNNDWRENAYNRFENLFANSVTTFLRPVDGQSIEVSL